MDLTTLRAEIKSWERAFKTEHQKNPTLDDIKALPKIAAKYKLYKKLFKEPTTHTAPNQTDGIEPTTPPRRTAPQPGPSSIVPKSRPVAHPANDATPNPFSPSKSSREKTMRYDEPLPKLNFMNHPSTPPNSMRMPSSSSQEAPFLPFTAAPEPARPPMNNAVRKARKRLRGDLVSPSPKKPRMAYVRLSPDSVKDSDSDDEETACVADSPVKASSSGKDFKPIFEESRLLQPDFPRKKGPFGRSKSIPDPFGCEEEAVGSQSAVQAAILPAQNKGKRFLAMKEGRHLQETNPGIGRQGHSGKSNLRGNSPAVGSGGVRELSPTVSGRKRLSPVDVDDVEYESQFTLPAGKLLPPSPPPSISQPGQRNLISQSANKDRKKPKIAAVDRNDGDQTDDDSDFQVVESNSQARRRHQSQREFVDEEDEGEALETFGIVHRNYINSLPEIEGDTSEGDVPDISLPENLRNVLHISSSHRAAREEQVLVESLLQGRPGPLDQRGEVWGIGEVEDAAATTTDDEWAGEGTPWEVGEL